MEFDVMAESTDGSALLVGECKWTNPEMAGVIHKQLIDKAAFLPLAQGKKLVTILFLKNRPKDISSASNLQILYPEDIIKMAYGEE